MSNIECNWLDLFEHYREKSFKFWLIMNTKLRNVNVELSFWEMGECEVQFIMIISVPISRFIQLWFDSHEPTCVEIQPKSFRVYKILTCKVFVQL